MHVCVHFCSTINCADGESLDGASQTPENMCGIAGLWAGAPSSASDEIVRAMTTCIAHRGPDDSGVWLDTSAGIALGHRRLSIVDLSPAGHQPMPSATGRYWTVFNGEIYNFRELRNELGGGGACFRGTSDTEVLLEAFEQWGVEEALPRFAGMFALAVWDRVERRLHLIRDRLGEKPLYYGWVGGSLVFGSELKALRAHPQWQSEIDRGALALFLRHSCVPAPYSIYTNVRKVVPGTMLTFQSAARSVPPVQHTYWSARKMAEEGTSSLLAVGDHELVDMCETRLMRTVQEEMLADVPLGAFLSGGIDSSLIVALMQANSTRRVRTFTIGFDVAEFNEAEYAKDVAAHLGTDHTEMYVTSADTLAVIPRLATLYDEPFADPSQVPTFLVAKLAREHVTVALSGDGGDELFGGYSRYFFAEKVWSRVRRVPRVVRGGTAAAIRAISPGRWDQLLSSAGRVARGRRVTVNGDRIHKFAGILSADSSEQLYRQMVSQWPDPDAVTLRGTEHPTLVSTGADVPALADFTSRMMYLDLVTYLPDDILVKVDRATMGVSLESRAPFLDHRVAEFAWRLPMHAKMRDGQGKWILRQVLERHVPRSLTDRPKMGFGVPIDRWLRGPLREWAATLLAPSVLRQDGFFDDRAITQKWDEHQSGTRNWQYLLWNVLMFQSWLHA